MGVQKICDEKGREARCGSGDARGIPLLERREKWGTPFLSSAHLCKGALYLAGGDVRHPPKEKTHPLPDRGCNPPRNAEGSYSARRLGSRATAGFRNR